MANTKKEIDRLWEVMRDALDKSYSIANASRDEQGTALRDYARDIAWYDGLRDLLSRETANERQHRHGESLRGFSAESGAKLILLGQVATGARAKALPDVTGFLHFRITAMQAQVIGFLIRKHLPVSFFDALAYLDYPQIMMEAGKR
jgi:hypothetical protein